MLVSGEIENVPLLDVLQVVAYSKQTGVLRVQGEGIQGSIVFERGAVVCGESTSTRALLERAAAKDEPRARLALRRVGTLAVLTELLGLRSGTFRFQGTKARLAELEGVGLGPFYDGGTLDTGELLLLVATAIDKPVAPSEKSPSEPPAQTERSHPRYAPTLVPVTLASPGSATLDGHLTNLSEGGALFHGDAFPDTESLVAVRFTLPGDFGQVACRARVAWVRADGKSGRRGAGLAFVEMSPEGRGRLASYLARYQSLADSYLEPNREALRR
ncbi:MAG TPA: DUF4388 domain-containing protein [Vicinamibacteria bacterium]|jgi:hypothetical protein